MTMESLKGLFAAGGTNVSQVDEVDVNVDTNFRLAFCCSLSVHIRMQGDMLDVGRLR
jgi:hypothetical protein